LNKYLTNIDPKSTIGLNGAPFSLIQMNDTYGIDHYLICRSHPTIMYMYSGKTNIVISNTTHHLKKGDLIFINSFEYYKHLPEIGVAYELFFLTFDMDNINIQSKHISPFNLQLQQLVKRRLLFPRFLPRDNSWAEGIKKLFENICIESTKDSKRTRKFIIPFIIQIISTLMLNNFLKKDHLHNKRLEKVQLLDNIFNILETTYYHENCIENLEEETKLTRREISKLILHFYELPLTKFINIFKIQKSMELFYKTNLSNTQLANKVGFNDPSYFDKIFKLVNEITPSQYRQELSSLPQNTLPTDWKEFCFGKPALKGSCCYENGLFKIKGPGNKYILRNDIFQSICKEFVSDFDFKCHASLTHSFDVNNFLGILIKEDLKQDSDYFAFLAYKSNALFKTFNSKIKDSSYFGINYIDCKNAFIRVQKQDQKIIISLSNNGTDWEEVFKKMSPFKSDKIYVCLTTSSRNPDRLSMAEFRIL